MVLRGVVGGVHQDISRRRRKTKYLGFHPKNKSFFHYLQVGFVAELLTALHQIKRHRGVDLERAQKQSLTHGKKTPEKAGGHEYESRDKS